MNKPSTLQKYAGQLLLAFAVINALRGFFYELGIIDLLIVSAIIVVCCVMVIVRRKKPEPGTGYLKPADPGQLHFYPRPHRIMAASGIAIVCISWGFYLFYCTTQTSTYQVTVFKFNDTKEDAFQTTLFNTLHSRALPPEFVKFTDGRSYIDTKEDLQSRLKMIAKGIGRTCNYKGFVVYGNVDDVHSTYSYYIHNQAAYSDSSAFYINGKEIVIINPPFIDLRSSYTTETSKLADFIIGLLYYSKGDYEEAIKQFRSAAPGDSSEFQFYSLLFLGYSNLYTDMEAGVNYIDSATAIDKTGKSTQLRLTEAAAKIKAEIAHKKALLREKTDESIASLKKDYALYMNDKMEIEPFIQSLSSTVEMIKEEAAYHYDSPNFTQAINRLNDPKELSGSEIYNLHKVSAFRDYLGKPIPVSPREQHLIDIYLTYRLYKQGNWLWIGYAANAF